MAHGLDSVEVVDEKADVMAQRSSTTAEQLDTQPVRRVARAEHRPSVHGTLPLPEYFTGEQPKNKPWDP